MKRYLGPLALLTALAVLTGCGDEPDDRADDRDPQEQTDEAEPGEGRVIGPAVIGISYDEPPSATVTEEEGAFVVTPGKAVDPLPECLVPLTSVAVLDLPA
jgi:hypothetical protein